MIESNNKTESKSGTTKIRIPDENGGKDWILEAQGDIITMKYWDGVRRFTNCYLIFDNCTTVKAGGNTSSS